MTSEFRIGSVPYLNAAPLTFGIERQITTLTPVKLAFELHGGRLDAALISVTETLFHPGYRLLDGFAIVSSGPVYSVFLAHQQPLEKIESIHVDTASSTSVNLLRVLLEAHHLHPEFVPLENYDEAHRFENVLLIGNPAIHFRARHAGHHKIWDLGLAWQRLTGLPFIYAAWALHVDSTPERSRELGKFLQSTARNGLSALPNIISNSTEFDLEFRRQYLGGYIQYRVSSLAKLGFEEFARRLRNSPAAPCCHRPEWFDPYQE